MSLYTVRLKVKAIFTRDTNNSTVVSLVNHPAGCAYCDSAAQGQPKECELKSLRSTPSPRFKLKCATQEVHEKKEFPCS